MEVIEEFKNSNGFDEVWDTFATLLKTNDLMVPMAKL